MNRTADLSLEDFRRLPGLYRRWELTEVCEPNRNYQICLTSAPTGQI